MQDGTRAIAGGLILLDDGHAFCGPQTGLHGIRNNRIYPLLPQSTQPHSAGGIFWRTDQYAGKYHLQGLALVLWGSRGWIRLNFQSRAA
jgi:hypothetical protein